MALPNTLDTYNNCKTLTFLADPFQTSKNLFLRLPAIKRSRGKSGFKRIRGKVPFVTYHKSKLYELDVTTS
jgi:hypothetical protein